MQLHSTVVALQEASTYRRSVLKEKIDALMGATGSRSLCGSQVLLKPNLITARRHDGLACTHPEFIAAAAEWFLDQGASVAVGDSPAFGSARGVMAACGIARALDRLSVRQINFRVTRTTRLAGGLEVGIAAPALECDYLVNLPRVKAHGQLLVSLAVKNYFGVVVGWRKPCLHMRLGEPSHRFAGLLLELLDVLPGGVTLVDGIIAMHRDGPIGGVPYPLGILAGAVNPVAADTALLQVLGIDPGRSPLWCESRRRQLPGSAPETLRYPLVRPAELLAADFCVPFPLRPVRFQPGRFLGSSLRRLVLACRGGA